MRREAGNGENETTATATAGEDRLHACAVPHSPEYSMQYSALPVYRHDRVMVKVAVSRRRLIIQKSHRKVYQK